MPVNVYKSGDAGAPQIPATATLGNLISILDACLVNGYGSKTGAGWTKAFTGTNVAAYKMPGGSGRYLRVSDTAAAGINRTAQVIGYGAMTDVDTGTDMWPLSGTNIYWPASGYNSSTNWALITDPAGFYFRIQSQAQIFSGFFGDMVPIDPADVYFSGLIASIATNVDSVYSSQSNNGSLYRSSYANAAIPGSYVMRRYDGATGSSYGFGRHWDAAKSNIDPGHINSRPGVSGLGYPNTPDGKVYLSPVWVTEATPSPIIRGTMPGLWVPLHTNTAFANGDTFSGTDELAGKTFIVIDGDSGARLAIETSDTWR